jgi:hypothetical protein
MAQVYKQGIPGLILGTAETTSADRLCIANLGRLWESGCAGRANGKIGSTHANNLAVILDTILPTHRVVIVVILTDFGFANSTRLAVVLVTRSPRAIRIGIVVRLNPACAIATHAFIQA